MKRKTIVQRLTGLILAVCVMSAGVITAFAEEGEGNKIAESSLYKGTLQMISDLTWAISMCALPVTILVVIYFNIRKAIADEADEKKWKDRSVKAIIAGIVAVCASAIVSLVTSYFI